MRTLDLCLHCGGYQTEYEKVLDAPTPPATDSHFPIPHATFVQGVLGALQRCGLEIVQQVHALAGDEGQRYFGLVELEHTSTDYAIVVGFRNSHDKAFSASLVAGEGIFICDNLAFHGEIKVSRKHTRYIMNDLTRLIDTAVGKLGSLRLTMDQRIEQYKSVELEPRFADHLLVEMLRAKIISSSQIGKVMREFEAPSHEEFTEHGLSAWRLANATTEVLKGTNVFELPKRTTALHGLLDQACGVTLEGTFERAA